MVRLRLAVGLLPGYGWRRVASHGQPHDAGACRGGGATENVPRQKITPAACLGQRRYRGVRREYRLARPGSQEDRDCDCRVRSNPVA